MANHQASEQMVGYLYQVRYALQLLLSNDKTDYRVSIEKYDDVAFEDDGTPKELIQLKHHVGNAGALSDSSVDLWRTLKVWMDMIKDNPNVVYNADFLLITTSVAPEDSAASYLYKENRDISTAYTQLKHIAETSKNEKNKKSYEAFQKLSEEAVKTLLDHIIVIDNADSIIDSEKIIRKHIKYCCKPQHEDFVFERLEGWWFDQSVKSLCSENSVFFTQNQVRSKIVEIGRQYDDDNLPIDDDIEAIDAILEENLATDQTIFLEQLRLLRMNNSFLNRALIDYYRAYQQRARWIRNELLYANDLIQYEQKLVDAWQEAFDWMQDDLESIDAALTEEVKVKAGKKLFREISSKDIRIRKYCDAPFVMKGSYHILANRLKVGWHIDFIDKLQRLLTIGKRA